MLVRDDGDGTLCAALAKYKVNDGVNAFDQVSKMECIMAGVVQHAEF